MQFQNSIVTVANIPKSSDITQKSFLPAGFQTEGENLSTAENEHYVLHIMFCR